MNELDPLLSTEELADYVGKPIGTIYKWRTKGVGPRGIKVGRTTRYRASEVRRWLEEQERSAA